MDTKRVISELRAHAFSILPSFSVQEMRDIKGYLLAAPVYLDAHVPETARKVGRSRVPRSESAGSECICVENHEVVRCPHIFERGLEMTDVAAEYLGVETPVAFSMNAFWTRPGPASTRPDIQEMHRDADDIRFLAMFVYLNDVIIDQDGPQELEGPDGVLRSIYGPAGTVFLADTSHPHRGRKPITAERGLAWYRWGVSPKPIASVWDQITPLPAAEMQGRYPVQPRLQESVKLIVAP